MNVKENTFSKETSMKLISEPKAETCTIISHKAEEVTQKEEVKSNEVLCIKEKNLKEMESIDNNTTQDLQTRVSIKYKAKHTPLLNKKRKRLDINAEETILDMDYLQNFSIVNNLAINPFGNSVTKSSVPEVRRTSYSRHIHTSNENNKSDIVFPTKQCHICNERRSIIEMKFCSMKNCHLFFCTSCLIKSNDVEDSQNSKENLNMNNWKCLKCRGRCKCHRCRVLNRKKNKQIPMALLHKESIDLKSLIRISLPTRVNNIKRKLVTVNDCNLYEIYEDDGIIHPNSTNINYTLDIDETIDTSIFSVKKIAKLHNVSKLCEDYYANEQYKEDLICFRCLEKNFETNEVLHLSSKKELMNYCRYCFIYMGKILRINYHAFEKNKKDLLNCDISFLSKWKFYRERVMCKYCFMLLLNMDELIIYLKNIFNDDSIPSLSTSKYNTSNTIIPKKTKKRLGKRSTSDTYIPKATFKRREMKHKSIQLTSAIEDGGSATSDKGNQNEDDDDSSSNNVKSHSQKDKEKNNNKNVTYDKINQILFINKKIFLDNETANNNNNNNMNTHRIISNQKSKDKYDVKSIDNSVLPSLPAISNSPLNNLSNSIENNSIEELPITFQFDYNNIVSNFNVIELYYISEKINKKVDKFLRNLPMIDKLMMFDIRNNGQFEEQMRKVGVVMVDFLNNLTNHQMNIMKIKEKILLMKEDQTIIKMLDIVRGFEKDVKEQIDYINYIKQHFLEISELYYVTIKERKIIQLKNAHIRSINQ